jgi:hypothetical protein
MKHLTKIKATILFLFVLTSYAIQGQPDLDFPDADFFDEPGPVKMSFEEQLLHVRGIMVERDAQSAVAESHKKIDKALHGFLQTEFMQKYRELKVEAESLVAAFKTQASQIPPKDVARVKKAYERISYQFNDQLVEIKRDFMDKKKLKLIKNNKEMYSNSLQYKLRELKDDFSQDFEVVVAEVTGSDMYAAVPLGAILGLIKLAADFTDFLIRSGYEARRVKEEHLTQYLMEPYRFKGWEEIMMLEGEMYPSEFMNDEPFPGGENEEYLEDMDPFVDEIPVDSLQPGKPRKNK